MLDRPLHSDPLSAGSPSRRGATALRRTLLSTLVVGTLSLVPAPASAVTLDSLTEEQWAIAPSAILNLPPAWALSRGTGVTVAMIDSGILATHRDLAANLWSNPGEVAGNRVDDDGNGYIDDLHGIDLTNLDLLDQTPDDEFNHGTHVAGIIAGARNAVGIQGVAYGSHLMAIKILDRDGDGTTGRIAEGIRYAVLNGAKVINISLNGAFDDQRVINAIKLACVADVVIVASAGNRSSNNDRTPSFPASSAAPCLVAVAATAPPGGGTGISGFSNYGRYTVALAAPGEEILSSSTDGDYAWGSGTSMAAPHVAGVLALMTAANPRLGAAERVAALLASAAQGPIAVSSGYVDAFAAVRGVIGASSYTGGQPPVLRIYAAQVAKRRRFHSLKVQVAVSGSPAAIARFRLRSGRRPLRLARPAARNPLVVFGLGGALRRVTVVAVDRRGRVIASVTGRVEHVTTIIKDPDDTKTIGTTSSGRVTVG